MATQKLYKTRPGPKRYEESVVGYYDYAAKFFKKHMQFKPVRFTLYKYMTYGYPIAKGGNRVALPIYVVNKRPMTTRESMERFLTVVRVHEARHAKRHLASAA